MFNESLKDSFFDNLKKKLKLIRGENRFINETIKIASRHDSGCESIDLQTEKENDPLQNLLSDDSDIHLIPTERPIWEGVDNINLLNTTFKPQCKLHKN